MKADEHPSPDSLSAASPRRLHTLGGLFEGVTVRSAHWHVAVVRRDDGSLVTAHTRVDPLDGGAGSWPLVRGFVQTARTWNGPVLLQEWAQSLAEGRLESALATPDEEPPALLGGTYRDAPAPAAFAARFELTPRPDRASSFSLFNMAFWVGLMIVLPHALAAGVLYLLDLERALTSVTFQVATGLMLPAWYLPYHVLIHRSPGVRRLVKYGTAAMQALVAHERGSVLSVAAVRRRSPLHPIASANAFALMMVVFPFVFHLASQLLFHVGGGSFFRHVTFLALKVASLPLVFSLVHELQQGAVRLFRRGRPSWAWKSVCGLQRFLVAESDDEQVETAILAVQEALRLETETEQLRANRTIDGPR
jgi:uncharacterized protein YqhQ